MKSLNFNSVAKKNLIITLNDDENTTLLVMSPTKKIMDLLISIEDILRSEDIKTQEQINALYDLCYLILSRNKGKIKIKKEDLEECFDIEDITIFLQEYMNFVSTQMSGKN